MNRLRSLVHSPEVMTLTLGPLLRTTRFMAARTFEQNGIEAACAPAPVNL